MMVVAEQLVLEPEESPFRIKVGSGDAAEEQASLTLRLEYTRHSPCIVDLCCTRRPPAATWTANKSYYYLFLAWFTNGSYFAIKKVISNPFSCGENLQVINNTRAFHLVCRSERHTNHFFCIHYRRRNIKASIYYSYVSFESVIIRLYFIVSFIRYVMILILILPSFLSHLFVSCLDNHWL